MSGSLRRRHPKRRGNERYGLSPSSRAILASEPGDGSHLAYLLRDAGTDETRLRVMWALIVHHVGPTLAKQLEDTFRPGGDWAALRRFVESAPPMAFS